MKSIINIVPLVFVFICFNSCKDNTNSPIQEDDPVPGSRDYSWKIDTLEIDGFDYLGNIWGESTNNVWTVGTGGAFHYDGIKWTEYKGMRWILDCLYGFASNNIWTIASGNYNGVNIFHYDGTAWINAGLFTNQTSNGHLWMNDMYGNSPSNIYAVGTFTPENTFEQKAVIMHFDGNQWSFLNLPLIDCQFGLIRQDLKTNGKYYLWGVHFLWDTTQNPPVNTGKIIKLFEFDGTNVKEISSNWPDWGGVTSINNSVYFLGENKLWIYRNNNFTTKIDLSHYDYSIGVPKGRSEKDLFTISRKKDYSDRKYYLTHYNGSDLVPLYSSDYIRGFEIIGDDIFILSLGQRWMIIHGTLSK